MGISCADQKHLPWRQNSCLTFCISLEMPRVPGNCNFGQWGGQACVPLGASGSCAAERKGGRGGWRAWSSASPSRHCRGRAGWHGARGALSARTHPVPAQDLGIPAEGPGPRIPRTQGFPRCLLLGQFWSRRECTEKNESGKGQGELRRKKTEQSARLGQEATWKPGSPMCVRRREKEQLGEEGD